MRQRAGGWTLIELVITMTVLTILSLGVIPMVKTAVRRQREYQLREALREMREAIKEFHRDTVGMQCTGGPGGLGAGLGGGIGTGGGAGGAGGEGTPAPNGPPVGVGGQAGQQPGGVGGTLDPRSKVVIADCTLFGVDNIDRWAPSLDDLVSGVNVIPRLQPGAAGGPAGGGAGLPELGKPVLAFKKKIYLRKIPVDPMTGKPDWCLHSPYESGGSGCSGGAGVFDVTSTSQETPLSGEGKYSDW